MRGSAHPGRGAKLGGSLHVLPVGGGDGRGVGVQRIGDRVQQGVFHLGVGLRQIRLGACGGVGFRADAGEHLAVQFIFRHKVLLSCG